MKNIPDITPTIHTLDELALLADYTLTQTLHADPKATQNGINHTPREVFSGHYVPVSPTPMKEPFYIAHSATFFKELGFDENLVNDEAFMRMFSGDLSDVPAPLKKVGWATGYALSIYGTEYYEQCPFKTGNGYGDGRAVSIFEGVINTKRWEMQLKGGGKTPYCRGADGRAVLRSSIREFLAQEHMYALGIPTSRSLTLYASTADKAKRPWFNQNSYSKDPEVMIEESVAITTRVAPSFLRVGQIELFGRRARKQEHPKALEELEMIVLHLIDREYSEVIDTRLSLEEKVLLLAIQFQTRLTSLVANWIRVGYCQGNFNSDNCAAGGFTLDYGPFGFIDMFDPRYQPWTGGGVHFSFFNQPQAAQRNFYMFYTAIKPLIASDAKAVEALDAIMHSFAEVMKEEIEKMWVAKLGLETFNDSLFTELMMLMTQTALDYTIFFRELSHIPQDITPLTKSFYKEYNDAILKNWSDWHAKWETHLTISTPQSREKLSAQMQQVNPKYTLREWHLVSAYQQADDGDYTLMKELQEVMTHPYDELSKEIEEKYYQKKPASLFHVAGVSHVSCSS